MLRLGKKINTVSNSGLAKAFDWLRHKSSLETLGQNEINNKIVNN